MANPTDLKVDDLNFEGIKDNLKSFLRAKDQFVDVNFDSSGISLLLDVLAYNTYYNSAYLNLATTESFLSTAQKRNSVVNLARNLNYLPRSTSSARIVGNISATGTSGLPSISLPRYTKFTVTVNGELLTFLTAESVQLIGTGGAVYTAENVELIEGTFVSERYVYNELDKSQRFIINNDLVDTSTLTVRVLDSTTNSTTRVFVRSDNIVELEPTSLAYFLEEIEDGKFQVLFGDDYLGKKLTNGNLIYLDYIVSSGVTGNDVEVLSYAGTVSGITSLTFTAADPASGGAERESIDSIRLNAPKSYEAQNRVVTAEDYKALLLQQSSVDSVLVWGGEDNDPPEFGKVFVAVKPSVGLALTSTEKQNLINTVIKPKRVLTVQTEIVDPEFIYLVLDCVVNYDAKASSLTENEIVTAITNVITNYNLDDLNQFSKFFRYSKLSRLIDFADRSVLNNVINIRLRREVNVQLTTPARYEINFSNAINNSTLGRPINHPYAAANQITSNEFTYGQFTNCFLEENNGIMRIYTLQTGSPIGVLNNVGTLDYQTGKIILTNFSPTSFTDESNILKITAKPAGLDILPLRNQILQILQDDVTITMVDDTTVSVVNR